MSILQSCLVCGEDTATVLCLGCEADLPTLSHGCPQCAEPTALGERCGRCLQSPPAFDRTLALFAYDFPLDQLVHALKYGGRLLLGEWFGLRLAAEITGIKADVIVPMPLHEDRLRERGYNQAMEISRTLARQSRITVRPELSVRTRPTVKQADLALKERHKNVRNAFFSPHALQGMHVLLVDDVMTTGTTLHECAKALKQQGAIEVTALIVARALKG